MEITKVYPLDAVFDNPDDIPEDVMDKFIDSLDVVHLTNSIIFVNFLVLLFHADKNK